MSEIESEALPETDDPYLLLDVSPETTPRELKRAYTRLVKRFRPERDPASFQRIVAAYQALRDGPDWAPEIGPSMSSANVRRDSAEAPSQPSASFENQVADTGDGLQDSADDSNGEQVVLEDLQGLYLRGELTWSLIQSQPEGLQGLFFSELAEFMLLDGSRRELLEIVDSRDFQAALLASREFDHTLFSIVADLYWDEPARAMALVADFPPSADDDWQWDRLDQAVAHTEAWAAVGAGGPLLKEVAESVRLLGMSVGGDTHLLERLSAQASVAPARLLESLDRLQTADPYLIIRMQQTVDEYSEPDTRIYQELEAAERRRLDVAMRDIERKLDKNVLNGLMMWMIVGGLGAGVYAPLRWSWLGLLVTFGVLVGLMVFILKVDGVLYRQVIRPAVLRDLVRDGIGLERVSEWISANTKLSDDIGRFDDEVDEDLSLILVGSLRRYALDLEIQRDAEEAEA